VKTYIFHCADNVIVTESMISNGRRFQNRKSSNWLNWEYHILAPVAVTVELRWDLY